MYYSIQVCFQILKKAKKDTINKNDKEDQCILPSRLQCWLRERECMEQMQCSYISSQHFSSSPEVDRISF